jgi:lambda repressor-like predicted transcriptional regulator
MNLYKLHANPETLDHYDIAHDKVPKLIWDKYENNPEELRKREAALAKDGQYAYFYAKHVLKGRWPAGEEAIAKDAFASYEYATDVLKAGFPAGEEAIAKDARYAYFYAKDVLDGPFPAGEAAIAKDQMQKKEYENFLKSIS